MANRIEIEVVAKDGASSVLGGINDALKEMAGISAEDLAVIGGLATAAGAYVGFLKNATIETLEYTQAVQEMARISGIAPEEASKLLAFLEDFGISASDAKMAARKLAEEGLVLDIKALQNLATEYHAIEEPAARQQFLLERLGRNGYEFADALALSSQRMGEMYDELNPLLVLTDESMQATQEYTQQVNELNRNWLAFKVSIGSQLVPQLSVLLGAVNDNWNAVKTFASWLGAAIAPALALSSAIANLRQNGLGYQSGALYVPPGGAPNAPSGGGNSNLSYGTPGPRAMGGIAGGDTIVGEMGPERVRLPRGSYVSTAADTRGGGNITLVYSPTVSLASEAEFERAAPIFGRMIRRELRNLQ